MTVKQSASENFPLQDYYSKIYKRYDLVNKLFTLGLDKKWRRITAEACLSDRPEKVLDLCCGTGVLGFEVHKRSSLPLKLEGYDFNEAMLSVAKAKITNENKSDINFHQGDAANLPFRKNEFDAIVIGFGFRNLTYKNSNAHQHLKEIERVLKPGGKFFILESAVPRNAIIRFFYNLYLRLLLIPLGGLISGNWKAYRYLALSSANYYNLKELEELLVEIKLGVKGVKTFLLGAANLIIAEKPGGDKNKTN